MSACGEGGVDRVAKSAGHERAQRQQPPGEPQATGHGEGGVGPDEEAVAVDDDHRVGGGDGGINA
jgi:hypothetical protein